MPASSTIRRRVVREEVVEVPEGHEVCPMCEGRAKVSKYDQGMRSLVHSDELAALRDCLACNGLGYREKLGG